MKILHTSDWHLGQTFFAYDRLFEHTCFLNWLSDVITEHQADALLISGDLYDSPNPSAASQRLFYDFIGRIKKENPHLQVIITSGNHDSGARLEAPDPLLSSMQVHVRGTVDRTDDGFDYDSLIIPLYSASDNDTPAGYCLSVPYLRQGDYPVCTDETVTNRYSWGVTRFYADLFEKVQSIKTDKQFIVAMGHLQTIGAELSEKDNSERTIIGGMDALSASMFDGADYVALGHIHKPQMVSKREFVRYAGSPLPMSFAEINYKHGVQLIEFDEGKLVSNERIRFEAPVKLMSVPAVPETKEQVLAGLEFLEISESDPLRAPYLEVKVIIDRPEPALRFEIENALEGKNVRLAKITPFTPGDKAKPEESEVHIEAEPLSPYELADQEWIRLYGVAIPQDLRDLFTEAVHVINKD